MASHQIFYVGTEDEVAHHAAPLRDHLPLEIVPPQQVARLANSGDLAIFFSEHFHRFRQAWFSLKQKGCHSLYAIDGILEWRNAWENRADEPACPWAMRPVLSDKVACIGASQARVLESWGNRGKTEIVGIPRLPVFKADGDANRTEPATDRRFRILVTTAKWPAFTDHQMQQVTQSLLDLKSEISRWATEKEVDVQVTWRLTGGLAEIIQVENQPTGPGGIKIGEALRQADAIITTPSTVMLEGMLANVPVCLLDYTNSPRYVDSAWSMTAQRQMSQVLGQLANPSLRKQFLQQAILQDAIQCQQDSSKRFAQLVSAMIKIGHDCRAANRPIQFPANILDSVPGLDFSSDRSWLGLFPELQTVHAKTDLEAIDKEALLAATAQSFRRVDHLQARVELLEKELERAAEGFQKIASHPILAPFLKVRKIAVGMKARIFEMIAAGSKGSKNDALQAAPSGDQTDHSFHDVRVKT